MVIAIDGPAGSGKSSTAKLVAERLGILHLDTGAMYRAVTLKCLRLGIFHTDTERLRKCVDSTRLEFVGALPNTKILLDGEDVSTEIRSERVTAHVSDYCVPRVVREALVEQQRAIGDSADAVCEGRDIGTVVFPGSGLKFYMVASAEERARRRRKDFAEIGVSKKIDELTAEIEERDRKDSTREISPLRKADDAEELDTTHMSLDEQVSHIVEKARAYGVGVSVL